MFSLKSISYLSLQVFQFKSYNVLHFLKTVNEKKNNTFNRLKLTEGKYIVCTHTKAIGLTTFNINYRCMVVGSIKNYRYKIKYLDLLNCYELFKLRIRSHPFYLWIS